MTASNNTNLPKSYVFVALFLTLLLICYRDTALSMVAIWERANTYTHCFFIVPISLWLIWEKRAFLSTLPPSPNNMGLLAIALCGAFWFVSNTVDVLVTQQLALIGMLITGIWALLGNTITKAILFPLLYLFFCVPIGDSLITPLMKYTAFFTVWSIKLTGIPVYQEGLTLQLPSGTWEVIEACSGIRYLIASICLGTLFAFLNYTSPVKRLVFFLFSIFIPILANGIRAFLIVILGHKSNLEFAAGNDHLLIGWVFYGLVIFILFAVGMIWRDPVESDKQPEKALGASFRSIALTTVSALALSLIWPAIAELNHNQNEEGLISKLDLSTLGVETTLAASSPSWKWQPNQVGANNMQDNVYFYQNKEFSIHIRQYLTQSQGREITNHRRFISDPAREWHPTDRASVKNHFEVQGHNFSVNQQILLRGNEKLLIWSWYRVGSRYTAGSISAKILQFLQTFSPQPTATTRIFYVTPIPSKALSAELALNEATDFLSQVIRETYLALDTGLREQQIQ